VLAGGVVYQRVARASNHRIRDDHFVVADAGLTVVELDGTSKRSLTNSQRPMIEQSDHHSHVKITSILQTDHSMQACEWHNP
jgi:hypothetical protein